MSVYTFPLAAGILSTLVLAVAATTTCSPNLTVRNRRNLVATYDGASIHYTCPGLDASNAWAHVLGEKTPAQGAATTFYIDVSAVTGSSEVRFQVLQDAILLIENDGSSARWVGISKGYSPIGPSNILPGSGTHSVTIARSLDSFSVVEDGKVVGTFTLSRTPAEIFPSYHVRLKDLGATLDMTVSGISLTGGVNPVVWEQ